MNPASTETEGTHALVALLRDHGVDVVVAKNVADVEHQMRPDTLLVVAETRLIFGPDLLDRLAAIPGDRLVVEPTPRALVALAPALGRGHPYSGVRAPDCALREANRAGTVDLADTVTYRVKPDEDRSVVSCYDGALVRYSENTQTITVVGSAEFMLNGNLLQEGNAALAMNLVGDQARVVWYAPQLPQGITSDSKTLSELIPDNVSWIVWQLALVVGLVAVWKARRLGPLVAEKLPVVVRASETVEGRGRLYRARQARDRAGQALRTATLQRLLPRLGLGVDAAAPTVIATAAQRSGIPSDTVQQLLFGAPPGTDADLLHLARALDNIERQVTHS